MPGQVVILKGGEGRMIYGSDVIEISLGHFGHGWTAMRDAKGQGQTVRVLIAFLSPHAPTFFIRRTQLGIDWCR